MANPFSPFIPSSVPIKPGPVSPFVILRPETQQTDATTTSAPPNASAAPKPSKTTVGTGLMEALNNYQLTLLNNKNSAGKPDPLIQIADQYEIIFADSIIADALMVPSKGLDKSLTAGATGGTAADQLLPNKQSMDPKSRARAASAGQQIVNFIDQVIRSSTYIQNQSTQVWNQSTGKFQPQTRQQQAKQFAWFQVLCNIDILGYDYIRNDNAYRMTFYVVPYETPMLSSYFPSGQLRGVHKSYPYWFTGLNNSVLSFEQTLNNQWTQAITGTLSPTLNVQKTNFQTKLDYNETWKRNVFPASGQSNQGGDKNTNEPGANAADFLYSSDLASAKITIVGDPAWLPAPDYIAFNAFTAQPFLQDGSINSIASGAYFDITFNTPADYNLQTGLIDSATAPSGQLNNSVTTRYVAKSATHIFKGGKFTQELEGAWIVYDASEQQVAERQATNNIKSTQSRNSNQSQAETTRLQNQNAAATPLPYGPRAPGGLGTARQSPNNNLGTSPLSPNLKNAPIPGNVVSGTLNKSSNSNSGQPIVREP